LTTIEETITKLTELRLTSMATAVRELMQTAPGHQLSFEEKLGIVVDREWTERDNRRLARRLKDAKLVTRASLDSVICDPERGVDKAIKRPSGN
jgi:DNA replication protein DnaC